MFEPDMPRNEIPRFGTITLGSGESALAFDYGRTYIVVEERKDKAFRIASEFIFSGSRVLCISRLHPDLIQERWPGKHPKYVWLSERSGLNNLAPKQLHQLGQRISAFIKADHKSIVVLDGIEYLALFNGFNRLQMFVEHLNDLAMETSSIVIIALDPRSFDLRSLARLRRFAEVVG